MNKKAIIIGSGIGGIATSVRLALKGYEVTVFEKDEGPGGKINLVELGKYRFDLGPSLFTMPHFVTELFEAAGKDPEDYFKFRKIDLACKYFWEDGMVINDWTDRKKLAEEIHEKLGVDKKTVHDYIQHSIHLYETTSPLFLEKSLHKAGTYFSSDFFRAGTYIHQMDIFKTMDKANKQRLKHPRLVQMFNRMATYNGSSPYKAPGILNIITSLEHGTGVFFPEKGMYSITLSLVKLAEDLGVTFRFSQGVEKINHDSDQVRGIQTSNGNYPADLIISNADIVPTYRNLLPGIEAPEKILRQERSSSALVYYWGINKTFPKLGLHNIFFSNNYPAEFRQLFEDLTLPDDPTIYVHISSKEKPDDAPPGHENWFVMVNAPQNVGQDWDRMIVETRQKIIGKLSRVLKVKIENLIEAEYVLDPRIIETKTSSFRGSLYGTSSNSKYAAFLRHPNFSSRIKGLYFVGGSVHPGGGIPLCLLGAKIVSNLID